MGICSESGYRDFRPPLSFLVTRQIELSIPAVIYRLNTGPKVTGPTDQELKMLKL